MLCVSECPSGSFKITGADFLSDIAKLKGIPEPVLACNRKPGFEAHVRGSCLGFLSEEHLAFLAISIEQGIQLNLTECRECSNGFIVGHIRKRLQDIDTRISVAASEKIKLIENREDLEYRDVSYNRRNFFKALTGVSAQGARRFLFNDGPDRKGPAYSEKKLPVRRELLNRMLDSSSNPVTKDILESFYYEIGTEQGCDYCFSCVAACPSGALHPQKWESGKRLLFNSSLCNGCGLCAVFCGKDALNISRGFHGAHPFQFVSCHGECGGTVIHEAGESAVENKSR
jgi:ferredoxin